MAASTPGATGREGVAGKPRRTWTQSGWGRATHATVALSSLLPRSGHALSQKDIASDVDPAAPWREVPLHRPVTYRVTQYPAGTHIAGHKHQRHQLVYAISGLMVVRSEVGRWVVPSTRAIWMPAGMVHAVDCIAAVHMRSLYIDPSFAPHLPSEPFAVQVAPLLRELLQAATLIKGSTSKTAAMAAWCACYWTNCTAWTCCRCTCPPRPTRACGGSASTCRSIRVTTPRCRTGRRRWRWT